MFVGILDTTHFVARCVSGRMEGKGMYLKKTYGITKVIISRLLKKLRYD